MDFVLFILKTIVQGIVEGVTEFLPVSSTGHLVIFGHLIGFNGMYRADFVNMFEMVIQLGAILAVIVLYWEKIKATLINLFPNKKVPFQKSGLRFWLVIAVACVPAAVIGLPLHDKIEEKLMFPVPVAIALVVGAIWMIYAENKYRSAKSRTTLDTVTVRQALIIGAFQCLSLFPGMSRSASTIIGAWIAGLSTVVGAEFSFFLAIPVMVGVTGVKLFKDGGLFSLSSMEVIGLAVGFLVSFIVALVVVDKFITFLKKKPMRVFAVYRIAFAIIVLIAGAVNLI